SGPAAAARRRAGRGDDRGRGVARAPGLPGARWVAGAAGQRWPRARGSRRDARGCRGPGQQEPRAQTSAGTNRASSTSGGLTPGDVDTGFAALLMLLTAVDLGLGALFFGLTDIPAFRAAFGVPEAYHPIGAVAIGYPAPDRRSGSLERGRRPPETVIHHGR